MSIDKFGRHIENHLHKKIYSELEFLKSNNPITGSTHRHTSPPTQITPSTGITQFNLDILERTLIQYVEQKFKKTKWIYVNFIQPWTSHTVQNKFIKD